MKVAIVGAGKLGTNVASALIMGDHAITAIDYNDEALTKINSTMDIMTVSADARNTRVFKDINIKSYDYLIACTGNDETNIVIASFAKKMGCKAVVARIRDPEHMNQFDFIKEHMGIDYIVNPDLSMATEIYKYLVEKYTLANGVFTSGKASLLEFKASRFEQLNNLPVTQFREVLPDMLAVALSRNGKVIVPHGDTIIQEDDDIYVIGNLSDVKALSEQVHARGKFTDLQKVMIIGGGKTSMYLARMLSSYGIAVKIIERDRERCRFLSANLEEVMVLHGDGTDIEFLEEENLDDMDAVVTTTGYDEQNVLLALIAKQHGVADVISKMSRDSYDEIVERIGIDMVLNPLNIEASHLLRYIQGQSRVISAHLIQGQAEILEIVASNDMPIANIQLKDLEIPEGVLICAIHRGDKLIIPKGDTVITEGDNVILLTLLSDIREIERLMRKVRKSRFFK